eukprot:scaffold316527_cov43-Prasinocladus_malaysianus.AAC.1
MPSAATNSAIDRHRYLNSSKEVSSCWSASSLLAKLAGPIGSKDFGQLISFHRWHNKGGTGRSPGEEHQVVDSGRSRGVPSGEYEVVG